jgi:hypothetical protein
MDINAFSAAFTEDVRKAVHLASGIDIRSLLILHKSRVGIDLDQCRLSTVLPTHRVGFRLTLKRLLFGGYSESAQDVPPAKKLRSESRLCAYVICQAFIYFSDL